jgi:hypothetical protein
MSPGGIRTLNPSKRTVADPRVRQCGHWLRLNQKITMTILKIINNYAFLNKFGYLKCLLQISKMTRIYLGKQNDILPLFCTTVE